MTHHKLNIVHLYPEEMNLYGDWGNVLTLKKRCEWRGIDAEIINVGIGTELDPNKADLFFLGGGQDNDQMKVYPDLISHKKDVILAKIEQNVPFLTICGGYQLLGEYFLDSQGRRIEGLGAIPIETVAPSADMKQRAVGNLITKLSEDNPIRNHYSKLTHLVGFENHSGRTRIMARDKVSILGEVVSGQGDNEDGISDGVIYCNTVCTYLHGSVLPKNPHLADFLIEKALQVKYNKDFELSILDDQEEISAHNFILKNYQK